jgi:hypothetical protein
VKEWVGEGIGILQGKTPTSGGMSEPLVLNDLAKKPDSELMLPADAPKALEEGTMKRFVDWHEKNGRSV